MRSAKLLCVASSKTVVRFDSPSGLPQLGAPLLRSDHIVSAAQNIDSVQNIVAVSWKSGRELVLRISLLLAVLSNILFLIFLASGSLQDETLVVSSHKLSGSRISGGVIQPFDQPATSATPWAMYYGVALGGIAAIASWRLNGILLSIISSAQFVVVISALPSVVNFVQSIGLSLSLLQVGLGVVLSRRHSTASLCVDD